jgi:hypothetical protein
MADSDWVANIPDEIKNNGDAVAAVIAAVLPVALRRYGSATLSFAHRDSEILFYLDEEDAVVWEIS